MRRREAARANKKLGGGDRCRSLGGGSDGDRLEEEEEAEEEEEQEAQEEQEEQEQEDEEEQDLHGQPGGCGGRRRSSDADRDVHGQPVGPRDLHRQPGGLAISIAARRRRRRRRMRSKRAMPIAGGGEAMSIAWKGEEAGEGGRGG